MEENKVFNVSVESVLDRYRRVQKRDYQIKCIKETVSLLNTGYDVMLNLPTGMGKTFVFLPIALEAAHSGFRVCIATPTRYLQKKIRDDLLKLSGEATAKLVYGRTNYNCPKIAGKAQNWYCRKEIDNCRKENVNCEVLMSEEDLMTSSFVVTNFSKFLTSNLGKPFSLVVLDDSHSFENAKEQAWRNPIQYFTVEKVSNRLRNHNIFGESLDSLLDIFDDIFDSGFPPESQGGQVPIDYIKKLREEVFKSIDEESFARMTQSTEEKEQKVLWDLFYFLNACKRSTEYRFYLEKDYYDKDERKNSQLIAMKNQRSQMGLIRSRFGESRTILATATPGDPIIHAEICTGRKYDDKLKQVPAHNLQEVEQWFDNLHICLIDDLGDVRTPSAFNRSVDLAVAVANSVPVKSLLLFKNYRDQEEACKRLKGRISRMFFIDDSMDEELIQDKVRENDVFLASASSILWEGIDIENLNLAMIFSPPFIRPPIYLQKEKQYPYTERRMLMRLQQGIGRLIRAENDRGVCILMDTNFEKYLNKSMFPNTLRRRVVRKNSSNVLEAVKDYLMSD